MPDPERLLLRPRHGVPRRQRAGPALGPARPRIRGSLCWARGSEEGFTARPDGHHHHLCIPSSGLVAVWPGGLQVPLSGLIVPVAGVGVSQEPVSRSWLLTDPRGQYGLAHSSLHWTLGPGCGSHTAWPYSLGTWRKGVPFSLP